MVWLQNGVEVGLSEKKYDVFGYIFWQYIFTLTTFLPVKFFWDNQSYHLFFLIFITLVSIWNGANYYFEVFSKRYIESLEQAEKKLNLIKTSIDASKKHDDK